MVPDVPTGLSGIRSDFARHFEVLGARTFFEKLKVAGKHRPLWALAVYRFGRSVASQRGLKKNVGTAAYLPFRAAIDRLTGVVLPVDAEVGRGVFIGDAGVVFLAPGCSVGAGSALLGGNTLGLAGKGATLGVPTVGANCLLRRGAVVVGRTELADGTVVGENAVVTKKPVSPVSDVRIELVPEVTASRGSLPRVAFWPAFRADFARHASFFADRSRLGKVLPLLLSDGLWASAVYRFGRAANGGLTYRLLEKAVRAVTGIRLDLRADIGPGFYIGHFGEIEVGAGVRFAEGCSISQRCRIYATASGAPTFGERAYAGAGAIIRGPVSIGADAKIGANALVERDVEPRSVVVGVPARPLRRDPSPQSEAG